MTNSNSDRFQVSLSRSLGLFDVTMIGVGAMIGAGIFGLTGIAAGEAGPVGLLLAFFLNGVVTSLTGLTYAELGAMYPQAGGGYAWVKLGLARVYGFYAGWISWFSHSVACALYAVLFGTFFAELLEMGGLHLGDDPVLLGLSVEELAVKAFAALVGLLFALVNVRGSSETGLVGNIITVFKVIVLGALVVFGLKAMAGAPAWMDHFLADPSPLPHGIQGVVLAMGLTFVAFEGYEIIAQSGEEVIEPERNVPRAIFAAIAVVVVIYVAVAFVSIGAMVQDSGLPNWQYMGDNGERAMIETARAIMPYGALVMILGGLASTMSALNATIYSSSRVSFAMGRDRDLPAVFGRIHPRNKTPHYAIGISAALIIISAVALPVADVASGASITFLLLFLMVNLALVRMRTTHADLPRPFRVPLVPWLQYVAIGVQLVLAIELFQLSPLAWLVSAGWLLLGIPVYRAFGMTQEARKGADLVLLEESVAARDYRVMVPVANATAARELARVAADLAQGRDGELFGLHVIYVPDQLAIADGRQFIRQGRPVLGEVSKLGDDRELPVRTMLRLARHVGQSITQVAREREVDLMVLGWPQPSPHPEKAFGSVVDLISAAPPCDLAAVRLRHTGDPRKIAVSVAGGPNARLALEVAITQADAVEARTGVRPEVRAVHVLRPGAGRPEEVEAELRERLDIQGWPLELELVPGEEIVEALLSAAEDADQIVVGASGERLLDQQLFGSIPQRLAEESHATVVMVKRHDPVKFGLRRWILRDSARAASG